MKLCQQQCTKQITGILRIRRHNPVWKPGQVCQEAETRLSQLSHELKTCLKALSVWPVVAGSRLMEKPQRLPDLLHHNWLKCNLLVGVFVQ